jgi:hypothetical protein
VTIATDTPANFSARVVFWAGLGIAGVSGEGGRGRRP